MQAIRRLLMVCKLDKILVMKSKVMVMVSGFTSLWTRLRVPYSEVPLEDLSFNAFSCL
jgi:hypothetical protein